jgi:acetyl-CoA carboxylase biotin carboxyl carrier protein
MSLDLDNLRALLDLLTDKDITEFEREEAGVRLRVVRGPRIQVGAAPLFPGGVLAPSPIAQSVAPPGAAPSANGSQSDPPSGDFVDVTSPFVGSFYRSPSPDTPAFVEVGSVVRAGQTLCIIEAMKLMNEIEADCAGTIVEIFVQNGKSVEYGQKLFRIKKA